MKWTPEKSAGTAYLLPAIVVGGIWYLMLFVGTAKGAGPSEMLAYALFEAPERTKFWWMALLPALSLLLAAGYFSAIANGKTGTIILCGVGVGVALAAWLTIDWTIAMFLTLPLLFSVPRATWHLTTCSKLDAQ